MELGLPRTSYDPITMSPAERAGPPHRAACFHMCHKICAAAACSIYVRMHAGNSISSSTLLAYLIQLCCIWIIIAFCKTDVSSSISEEDNHDAADIPLSCSHRGHAQRNNCASPNAFGEKHSGSLRNTKLSVTSSEMMSLACIKLADPSVEKPTMASLVW